MGIATLASLVVAAFPVEIANCGFLLGQLYKYGRNNGVLSRCCVILEIETVIPLVVSALRFLPFLLDVEEEEEEEEALIGKRREIMCNVRITLTYLIITFSLTVRM